MTADDLALRLSTLVERPTQITETLWGPRLLADSCTEADPPQHGHDGVATTQAGTQHE